MERSLTLNLDFVLMLMSGLLLLVASTGWTLGRIKSLFAWRWFAAYAGAQAVHAWLELATLANNEHPLITTLREMLRASSYLLLVEFARAGSARAPGRWIHLPLSLGLLGSILLGGEAGGVWSRAIVAMIAGASAAGVFLRWSRNPDAGPTAPLLRQAAWLVVAIQLLISVPGRLIDEDAFTELAGLPLALVRVAFAALLAVTIFRIFNHHDSLGRSPEHMRMRLRRRAGCGLAILAIGVVGWVCADIAGARHDALMREQILLRARLCAATIAREDVHQLRWDDTDLASPAYQRLKAQMIALRHANPDLRFVLLLAHREGNAYFLVDSEPPESEDYSPPGQHYDEIDPADLAALASRRSYVHGPSTDRWGTWMFGSVPLVEFPDGRSVNIELDVAASDWLALVHTARLPVLLITLLFGAMVGGAFRLFERVADDRAAITVSEQRNRSIVEGSPNCVQMFDAAGRCVTANANGLAALGLREAQVLGRPFADMWPESARSRVEAAVRTTLAGSPANFEADYVRPDGRAVTWHVATNPVRGADHEITGFVAISVDLTLRTQAERALLAAKEAAESATRAKSEFLAVMSHEIRTPLAGVIGMLDLLKKAELAAQPRRHTELALDSAESLLHLLDDALDTAKIEAGRVELEKIPFQPRNVFRSTCEAASTRAAAKGLAFDYEFTPAVPTVLVGDSTRLRQVVNNLQNNALKFTERGGVSVRFDAEARDDEHVLLKISVRDTGIGIPEATRAQLFSKFTQADASTTRRYGGTGLGLYIVRNLAELMGGAASVESVVGEGSTFHFTAVLAVGRIAEAEDLLPALHAPRRDVRLRILVAEDDGLNRMIAESLVTSFGHEVSVAHNGREAVDALKTRTFDLVLMDMRMPVMDGLTATRLIRDPATGALDPAVYIVALTANASDRDHDTCRAAGMDDFLAKPLRAPAFSAMLDHAIDVLRSRGIGFATQPPFATPRAPADAEAPAGDAGFTPPGLDADALLAAFDADTADTTEPTGSHADVGSSTHGLPAGAREKIVELFLRETPRRLALLESSFAAGDLATFAIEAHALKGNARYVDAPALAELALKLEHHADAGEARDLPPLLAATCDEFAKVRDRLLTVANS